MEKIVSPGERVTTFTLDGTECAVKFASKYRVFCVKSDSNVTVALASGKSAGDDGVMVCKAGESIMYPHMRQLDTVYITGSGSVAVYAGNEAVNPFKDGQKGGESGNERHYIYLNGEELNGHTITSYAYYGSDITKESKCIILNSSGNVFIESEMIPKGKFTRVGVRLCTVPWSGSGWYACRIGISNTLGYASGWATEQKYPAGNFKYMCCTPDQNNLKAIDEFYIDIPDTYSEFCAIVQICYRITYVGAIWLE